MISCNECTLLLFSFIMEEIGSERNVNNGIVCVMIRVYHEKRNNSGENGYSWNFERRDTSHDSFSKICYFFFHCFLSFCIRRIL